jgi:hypothetical protein
MKAQRLPHVSRRHLPPETAQEPAWRLAVGLVGLLLVLVVACVLAPGLGMQP